MSLKYSAALGEAGIRPSVGTVGDSYDNALAEIVNGLYRAELIHAQGPWTSVGEVELATSRWVHWWSTKRLHEALDYATPQEAETDSPRHVRRQDSLEGSVSWDVPVSIRASFVSALSVWSPRCEPTIRASIRR